MNTEESEQDVSHRSPELKSIQDKTHLVTTQTPNSKNATGNLNKFVALFKSLPNAGKLIVVGVGIIVGFAILKSLLNLVAALFSLAFLGLVVYFVYQFIVARSTTTIEK